MTDETDTPQGGTEGAAIAQPSQVETPQPGASEDTAEQQTGAEDAGQADDASDAPKRKPWWEKRFDELTAKRYAAETEAAYWRGQAEAGQPQRPQQSAPQAGQPPKEEDYQDWDTYQRALTRYEVRQELEHERAQEQRAAVARTYEERVAAVRDKLPDYDLYVGDPNLPISNLMAEVIRESDVGPEIAYFLGKNPTEAKRIYGLSGTRQAATLGRLEERLTADATKLPTPKPIPPAPPQTVAGLSAGLTKSLEEMSMDEYVARAKADGRI